MTQLNPPGGLARVSRARPIAASWTAYAGHTMYVGIVDNKWHGPQLIATDALSDAAGFQTVEACRAALAAKGFDARPGGYLMIGAINREESRQ